MSHLLKYFLILAGLLGAAHAFAMAVVDTTAVDTLEIAASIAPAEAAEHLPTYLEKLIAAPYTGIMAGLVLLLFSLFIWFRSLANKLKQQLADPYISEGPRFDLEEARSTAIASRQTAKFFGWTSCLGYLALHRGCMAREMQGYVMQWLNLAVRWTHVIAGIMWIGASFYFIFLENNLNRTEGLRDELAGNLWAIHGGGFYYVEKYKVAPKEIPKHLHWFKYEAYFTWLSGFSLMFIVYYADAKAFMIDPTVAALSTPAEAIGIGIGSMVLGWVIYDAMSKIKLGVAAGPLRAGGRAGTGCDHLRPLAPAQRTRGVHPRGRVARDDHGGQRLLHHHPQPESLGARREDRPAAGRNARQEGRAAQPAQQLHHAAGGLHHAQQPLPEHLRAQRQLDRS